MKAEKFWPSPTGSMIVKRTLPGGSDVSSRSITFCSDWTASIAAVAFGLVQQRRAFGIGQHRRQRETRSAGPAAVVLSGTPCSSMCRSKVNAAEAAETADLRSAAARWTRVELLPRRKPLPAVGRPVSSTADVNCLQAGSPHARSARSSGGPISCLPGFQGGLAFVEQRLRVLGELAFAGLDQRRVLGVASFLSRGGRSPCSSLRRCLKRSVARCSTAWCCWVNSTRALRPLDVRLR